MGNEDYITRLEFYRDLLRSEKMKINPDYDKIMVYTERINYIEKIISTGVIGITHSPVVTPQLPTNSNSAGQLSIAGGIFELFSTLTHHQQKDVILDLIKKNEETDIKKAILIVQDLGAHSGIIAGLPDIIGRYRFKQLITVLESSLYGKYNIKKGQLAGDGRFNVCVNNYNKSADMWALDAIEYCLGMIDGIRNISGFNSVYAPLYIRFGLHVGHIYWDANLSSEENIAMITSPEANITGHIEKQGKKYRNGNGSIVVISKDVFDMLPNTRKQIFKEEAEKIDGTACYTYEENLITI
ncbi:MAG: hypothetical protein SFH39_00615 [Candidatus Magnetobacterium sp. LHC-1]|nr:hypothetical protein [Nitrospirota bacterium]